MEKEIEEEEVDCVTDGSYVILREINGERFLFADIGRGKKMNIGRHKQVPVDALIGAKYDSFWELHQRNFRPYKGSGIDEFKSSTGAGTAKLAPNEQAQVIDEKKVAEMREKGYSGSDIIQALIKNSKTFDKRTDMAKEKYLKRKAKKYLMVFELIEPTTYTILKTYWCKAAYKIMHLRYDSLAHMLNMTSIHSGMHVTVVENTKGVILGTVLDRLRTRGVVLNLHTSQEPGIRALDIWNFKQEERDILYHYPIVKITEKLRLLSEGNPEAKNVKVNTATMPSNEKEKELKLQRVDNAVSREAIALAKVDIGISDALLICAHDEPSRVMKAVYPLLRAGCPFAVYCQYIEPLAHIFAILANDGSAVYLRLVEYWTREYQVAAGRTHPMNNMSNCGGYILTGFKAKSEWGLPSYVPVPQEEMGNIAKRAKLIAKKHVEKMDTT